MKRMLIKWLAPVVFDTLVDILYRLAHRSDTDIDDKIVQRIVDHRDQVISALQKI